jgi:hypothetical protein
MLVNKEIAWDVSNVFHIAVPGITISEDGLAQSIGYVL